MGGTHDAVALRIIDAERASLASARETWYLSINAEYRQRRSSILCGCAVGQDRWSVPPMSPHASHGEDGELCEEVHMR